MREAGVAEDQMSLVGPHAWQDIIERAGQTFTVKGKAASNYGWWWNILAEPNWGVQAYDPIASLIELVDAGQPVWFMVEDRLPVGIDPDPRPKRHGCFWLYESTIKPIHDVLCESGFSEYMIVSKKFDWLLGENHHGVLFACGQLMVERLKKVRPVGE